MAHKCHYFYRKESLPRCEFYKAWIPENECINCPHFEPRLASNTRRINRLALQKGFNEVNKND
jgi:hypothetical protein